MAAMLDLPRMRAALHDLPDQTELDPQKYFGAELTVPTRPARRHVSSIMSKAATSPRRSIGAAPSPEPPRN